LGEDQGKAERGSRSLAKGKGGVVGSFGSASSKLGTQEGIEKRENHYHEKIWWRKKKKREKRTSKKKCLWEKTRNPLKGGWGTITGRRDRAKGGGKGNQKPLRLQMWQGGPFGGTSVAREVKNKSTIRTGTPARPHKKKVELGRGGKHVKEKKIEEKKKPHKKADLIENGTIRNLKRKDHWGKERIGFVNAVRGKKKKKKNSSGSPEKTPHFRSKHCRETRSARRIQTDWGGGEPIDSTFRPRKRKRHQSKTRLETGGKREGEERGFSRRSGGGAGGGRKLSHLANQEEGLGGNKVGGVKRTKMPKSHWGSPPT